MAVIYPQAESFLLTGGEDTACLFIHGFSASPSEVYHVAKTIYEMTGCTMSGPLLPGHGCSPEEMNQTCWQDWFDHIEQEVAYLKRRHARVFVAGLSMGGLLALYTASRTDLEGVVAINTPIFYKSPRLIRAAPLLQYVRPYYPKERDQVTIDMEAQGRFAYPVLPVKALLSMQDLRRLVVKELPQLDLPILLFQSAGDKAVHPSSAQYIKKQAVQAQVKLIELENSGHIATMGQQQLIIAEEISDFIK
ncbi:MAG: alpha/beta fold hydrolase [Firmicutes bacterium]|nr:alpha/beta fold hydrolase [Bacillota bacterium]